MRGCHGVRAQRWGWNAVSSAAFQGVGGKGRDCSLRRVLRKRIAFMLPELLDEVADDQATLVQRVYGRHSPFESS